MQTLNDILAELHDILSNAKKNNTTFQNLCTLLGGHNYNEELFDVNYGSYCFTILNNYEIAPSFEVWDDEENMMEIAILY